MSPTIFNWPEWLKTSVLRIDARVDGQRLWARGRLEPVGAVVLGQMFRRRHELQFLDNLRQTQGYPPHWASNVAVRDMWVLAGLILFNEELSAEDVFEALKKKVRSAKPGEFLTFLETQTRKGWLPLGIAGSDPKASAAATDLERRCSEVVSRGRMDSLLPVGPPELNPKGDDLDFPLSEFCAMLLLAYADLKLRLTYPAAPVIAEELSKAWRRYESRDEMSHGVTPLPPMKKPEEHVVEEFFSICSDDGAVVTKESFFENYLSFFPQVPESEYMKYFGKASPKEHSDEIFESITSACGGGAAVSRENWMELTRNNHIATCIHMHRGKRTGAGYLEKAFAVNMTLTDY